MAEFFQLSITERIDALNAVADISGLPPHLLKKDIWGVWSLHPLFTGPYAQHLVFKGDTSLSKAYGVIRRFSDDVYLSSEAWPLCGHHYAQLLGGSGALCTLDGDEPHAGACA